MPDNLITLNLTDKGAGYAACSKTCVLSSTTKTPDKKNQGQNTVRPLNH
ncbi:hypothetical protein CGMCC3_g17084 [Colletotrichum fructicola]|nr:uncharacterized protein CGMCC3_g17084 [Colletotrichum fructicola]KAE9566744.1 hypothetical protein CGMCC3_g17084 [Colletotrichum fructicola]